MGFIQKASLADSLSTIIYDRYRDYNNPPPAWLFVNLVKGDLSLCRLNWRRFITGGVFSMS